MRNEIGLVVRIAALVSLAFVSSQANAQTLTTLYSFNGSVGFAPSTNLTVYGSTLYGTTGGGGATNDGVVFSLPVNGGSATLLCSFGGGSFQPDSSTLTLNGSTLYGMTYQGGTSNLGSVFSIPITGGDSTTLLSFTGTNGEFGYGGLTLIGSTLYGMTEGGGAYGDGTVFSINTNGSGYKDLLDFNGVNGKNPWGYLTLSGSTFYGLTTNGGINGLGSVFSMPVSGGTATSLYSFSAQPASGNYPHGGLVLSGSTLYGTTFAGGTSNDGTVFSLPVSGGSATTLLNFTGPNGDLPPGFLTLINGTLFGMTEQGGANNDGTIFSLPVSGGTATILSFNGNNGSMPFAGFTLNGSILYGTTLTGGTHNAGTVFALNIAPATIVVAKTQNATIITGGTGTLGMTLSNSPTSGYNLNYTLGAVVQSGSAALSGLTPSSGSLAPGGSQSCAVSATSTYLGVNTVSFTASDPNSSNLSKTTTATLTVLDHAVAAFANGSGTLNLNFGTLQQGSGTQSLQFQIENLPAVYRAGLDLDSVMVLSDPGGVFSTDTVSFSDLPAGKTSNEFNLFLNTSQIGQFSGVYQFNLSDEQDLSGHAGAQTLTLNVTANVTPEPSALVLLAAGTVALVGYSLRRRAARRTANPAAFDPQDAPPILSFHSHASPAHAARRAA